VLTALEMLLTIMVYSLLLLLGSSTEIPKHVSCHWLR
jgi:hypothetical protein